MGGEIFRTCPDRPWGPSSLLYNGYRVFPGGKERSGRDADPSPPSSAVGHERVELYLYSPYGPYGLYRASVPVQGCTLTLLKKPVDYDFVRKCPMSALLSALWTQLVNYKGKVHPRTGHESTEEEQRYSPTLSLTSAPTWGELSTTYPTRLTPREREPVPIL